MTYIRNPFITILALLLCGCGAGSMEPIEIESMEMLRISGALNTSFLSESTEYQCRGTIKSWDIGHTLILSVQSIKNAPGLTEQASLYMYIPLESNEIPAAGEYLIHDISDDFSGLSYKSQWGKNSFSKYRFEAGLARLIIESSSGNQITGRFSLEAKQSFGQRTLKGQVENIRLANERKITVSGKIDFELDI